MQSKVTHENGNFVFERNKYRVEVDTPVGYIPTLKVKGFLHGDIMEEVKICLTTRELEELGTMLIKASEVNDRKINKAELEASLIMEMAPPIEYVITYIRNAYKQDQDYANYLRNKLLELNDYQRDRDYDNDEKIYWFNLLNKSLPPFSTEEVKDNTTSNSPIPMTIEQKQSFVKGQRVLFESGVHDSESDYWNGVAEDSGMSMEEYFNSED